MVTIKEEVEVLEGEFCVSCACFSAILVEKKLYVIACLYFTHCCFCLNKLSKETDVVFISRHYESGYAKG